MRILGFITLTFEFSDDLTLRCSSKLTSLVQLTDFLSVAPFKASPGGRSVENSHCDT